MKIEFITDDSCWPYSDFIRLVIDKETRIVFNIVSRNKQGLIYSLIPIHFLQLYRHRCSICAVAFLLFVLAEKRK
jgi:hypothetical protein